MALSQELLTIKKKTRVQTTREYTPNVIKPSFGIGRILYSLLEHVYWNRPQDAARAVSSVLFPSLSALIIFLHISLNFCLFLGFAVRSNQVCQVLSLPLAVAPTKVLIVSISSRPQFSPLINKLSARLRKLGISNNVDSSSASIGKRYARNDELGTPLGITIDFDTVADGSLHSEGP